MGTSPCLPNATTNNAVEVGSYDVAVLANDCNPRYHFTPSHTNTCFTSHPYTNTKTNTNTPIVTRFIALAPFQSGKQKIPKEQKCIHALSLQPLTTLTTTSTHTTALPSPYTTILLPPPPPPATAMPMNVSSMMSQTSSSYSYFGNNNQMNHSKRKRENDNDNNDVDENNTSLFVHGLHKDVTGQLSNARSSLVYNYFQPYGCINVRIPTSRRNTYPTYCFLDFPTHDQAKSCLAKLQQQSTNFTINNVPLSIKWSTSKPQNQNQQQPPKKTRLTEQDAIDSSSLFLRVPQMNENGIEAQLQHIQQMAQTCLEDAMNQDNEGEDKITADNEPALKVNLRLTKTTTNNDHLNFGFLDFASHVAANMAIATLTGDVNGGTLLDNTVDNAQLYWAKPYTPAAATTITTNSCWFCLASPNCDQSLIVRVQKEMYIAMSRGPMHPQHCILVPIAHDTDTTPGIFTPSYSKTTAMEILDTLNQLCQTTFHSNKDIHGVFIFERAIPTKAGVLHSHLQCIPLSTIQASTNIIDTFIEMTKSNNMDPNLQEVDMVNQQTTDTNGSSELILSTLHQQLNQKDQDETSSLLGYFYAQIVTYSSSSDDNEDTRTVTSRRFLYKHVSTNTVVPVQLGRQVVATVLDQQDLADWKNCTESKQEEENTIQFRQLLSSMEQQPEEKNEKE